MAGYCDNCGAPRDEGQPCAYCRAGGHAFSLGELASTARRDARVLAQILPNLARGLEEALPGQVRVDRSGGHFGRGRSEVRRVEARVGEHLFALAREGDQLRTSIVHTVRGIELNHEYPPPPVWLDRLADALTAHAAGSVDVRPALDRLLNR